MGSQSAPLLASGSAKSLCFEISSVKVVLGCVFLSLCCLSPCLSRTLNSRLAVACYSHAWASAEAPARASCLCNIKAEKIQTGCKQIYSVSLGFRFRFLAAWNVCCKARRVPALGTAFTCSVLLLFAPFFFFSWGCFSLTSSSEFAVLLLAMRNRTTYPRLALRLLSNRGVVAMMIVKRVLFLHTTD